MDVCEPAQIGPAAVAGTAVSSRRARGMRGHATNPSAGVSRAGGADPSSKEKAALRCGRLARYRRRTGGHAVDTWCHCKLSHRSDEDTKLGSDKKFEQVVVLLLPEKCIPPPTRHESARRLGGDVRVMLGWFRVICDLQCVDGDKQVLQCACMFCRFQSRDESACCHTV